MPTIITHAVVPIAIAVAAGPKRMPTPVAAAGAVLAMVPDADVIGFGLGTEYADTWGHRGATHALAFALLVTAALAVVWRQARAPLAFAFLFLATASHGLLDALTDGGLGIALFWPVDNARHFAPFTPIRVSPIGADFFSARGPETLVSELRWVWLPCAMVAAAGWLLRKRARPTRP